MNRLMKRWLGLLIPTLAMIWPAQASEPVNGTGVEYFETHIRPLLAERCYRCHSARTGKRKGGLLLDSRSGWSEGGHSGPAVVPGDVETSLLIRAVRYTDPKLKMPPGGALPQEAIARLEQWVQMGAPDPRVSDPLSRNATADVIDPSDPIAGRDHWAFRPLASTIPPVVDMSDWPRSAVDRFVLSRLEAVGLRPVSDARADDLVRRVYFQLTGLPPTPQQMQAFVDDPRPDALERLVDRLLDSPDFGRRWGRHWLDLARYADSNGLDENFLFREAWRYRNWVVDAVNADQPFDRFLLEQIVGDLLPYESVADRDRQRIAAGFLVIGPKVLLGNDDQNQRMEIADEQLDTIGRAILGQTVGCARCHDHKFDPIPTADYYALAGILTSTQVMENRYMLNQQRDMERLVGIGLDGEALDRNYEQYWVDQKKLKATTEKAKSALALLNKGDDEALQKLGKTNEDALAEGAADTAQTMEQRIAAQQALIARLDKTLGSPPAVPPRAMVPADAETPSDEHIRLGGVFDSLGKEVPRGFLQVVCTNAVPEIPEGQSGRLQLGHWLTDVDRGAGRLAARVLANRVWHHLIGRGIVRTVDNFGRAGEPPSHPELLDYLAAELIESGWSVKALVREIVLSRTNMLSSDYQEAAYAQDPENRLLWRFNRRRLAPEAMRDAILVASGQLDRAPMKSTVWYLDDQATGVGSHPRRRTDFPCRSIYLPVIRNDLPDIFEVFDFADPHATTGRRPLTTVATQGLYLLNADLVMDASESTARRLREEVTTADPIARIDRMFALILNSTPTELERGELAEYIDHMQARLAEAGESDAEQRAWAMACHVLFASSRFQFLE